MEAAPADGGGGAGDGAPQTKGAMQVKNAQQRALVLLQAEIGRASQSGAAIVRALAQQADTRALSALTSRCRRCRTVKNVRLRARPCAR